MLAAFPSTLLVVELKPDPDSTGTYERNLADTLRAAERGDDVYVASFLDHNLALFSAYAPEFSTSPGTAGVAAYYAATRGPLPGTRLTHDVLAVPQPGEEPVDAPEPVVTQDFVDDAHANELAVHVFTVNDCSAMVDLLALGVDALYTDAPTLLEAVLATPPDSRDCVRITAADEPAPVVPAAPLAVLLPLAAAPLLVRRLLRARSAE